MRAAPFLPDYKTELKEKRENKEMQCSYRKHIRAVGWDGGKANIY